MNRYYISFGSNMDQPVEQVKKAVEALSNIPGVELIACSSLYRTPPWGKTDQADFINGALAIRSDLDPFAILSVLQKIEQEGGRERVIRWGPRTIDLDIIYAEKELAAGSVTMLAVDEPSLTLPHPHFWDRTFVLLPLQEVYEEFEWQGVTIETRLQELGTEGIEKLHKQ